MDSRRVLDLALILPAAPLAMTAATAIAAAVWLLDGRPVFFKQTRVGRGGRTFHLLKFRSMTTGAGPAVTSLRDHRITPVGRMLRRYKLDELPQLYNVLRGEMSLVGPRPESPMYVAQYKEEWRRVLLVRPGLTDSASLAFSDEETLLALADDLQRAYVEAVLPEKIALALDDLARVSWRHDLRLIVKTLLHVFALRGEEHPAVARARERIMRLAELGG